MQKSINDGNTTFIEIIKKYKIRFNPIIEAIETIIKIQNNINNQNQDSNIKLKDQKLDEVPKKEEYKEELAYFKELNEALKAQKYKSNRLLKYDTILILELLAKKAAGENTNWQKKIKKGFSWAKNTIVELFEEKNKEEKNKEEKNNLDNLNKQEKKLNKQTKEIIDQINKAHVLDFKGGIYANPNNCLLSNLVSTSWQTIKFSFNNNSLSTKIAMIGTPTVTLAAIGYFSGIGGMGSATLKTVELFFDFLKKFASDNSGKIIGSIGTLSTAGIVKLCTNNPCYNCPKNVNRNVIYCKECRKELFEKLLKHYQICTNKENCFECNDYNYILNTH